MWYDISSITPPNLATSLSLSQTASRNPCTFSSLKLLCSRGRSQVVTFWRVSETQGSDQASLSRVKPSSRGWKTKCPAPYPALSWPLPIVTPTPRGRHLARRGRERLGGIGNNKSRGTCCSLCSPSKSGGCRPGPGCCPGPVTRRWRADGTSTSSCGGLLKWLTRGYHPKHSIINAWALLFCSLALEPVHFIWSPEGFGFFPEASKGLVTDCPRLDLSLLVTASLSQA